MEPLPNESLSHQSRVSRADRVFGALRQLARHGLVCERTGIVAELAGVSVDTVARAVDDLLADERIEATGLRASAARQFRIRDESAQLALGETTAEEKSLRDSSAVRSLSRSSFVGSPMGEADRKWMRSPWQAERFDWPEYLAARSELERLCHGVSAVDDAMLAKASAGDCEAVTGSAPGCTSVSSTCADAAS